MVRLYEGFRALIGEDVLDTAVNTTIETILRLAAVLPEHQRTRPHLVLVHLGDNGYCVYLDGAKGESCVAGTPAAALDTFRDKLTARVRTERETLDNALKT